MQIQINITDFLRVTRGLSQLAREAPRAYSSAVNRALDYTRNQVHKEVLKEYDIQAKSVKETLSVRKASPSNLNGYIKSSGRIKTMGSFKYQPKTPHAGKANQNKPVKSKIKKSSGFKVVKTIHKAFVQKVRGYQNIWKRTGQKRYPLQILKTLSVPQMISNSKIYNIISSRGANKLIERLDHEINFRLNRISRR